jgi:hypothetical protein
MLIYNERNNPFTNYYLLIDNTNKKVNNINKKNYLNDNKLNDNYLNDNNLNNKNLNNNNIFNLMINNENYDKKINKKKELIKNMYKALFLYNYFLSGWNVQIIDKNNVKLLKKIK